MSYGEVAFLAIVQGLTEFLPVSSSGHLLAARLLFGLSDENGTAIDAFLHLGTLVAVVTYYWRTWIQLLRGVLSPRSEDVESRRLAATLAVATVPAAVIGYTAQDGVANLLRTPGVLAGALVFTAVVLLLSDRRQPTRGKTEPTMKDGGFIGLIQVLALIPGVSRAGVTMAAGRARGLSRHDAARFSFLLSAPIIAGAGFASLGTIVSGSLLPAPLLIVGFLLSLVSGLAAIHGLMKLIERFSFAPFSLYLIVLALVVSVLG